MFDCDDDRDLEAEDRCLSPLSSIGSLDTNRGLDLATTMISKRIGREWVHFAEQIDSSPSRIQYLADTRTLDYEGKCRDIIDRWRKKRGRRASTNTLIEALRWVERNDIAHDLEDRLVMIATPDQLSPLPWSRPTSALGLYTPSSLDGSRVAPKTSSSWPNSSVASLTSDDIQYEQQFKKVEKACLDDVQNEKMHHHICFVLLGRTAVGKSTTADNAFGTITLDQINLAGIETSPAGSPVTSTRVHCLRGCTDELRLSVIDGPGLGSSSENLSVEKIANLTRQAVEHARKVPFTRVIPLYFVSGQHTQDWLDIDSIRKYEKALQQKIEAVVVTHASHKPKIKSFPDDLAGIRSNWFSIREEYCEKMTDEYSRKPKYALLKRRVRESKIKKKLLKLLDLNDDSLPKNPLVLAECQLLWNRRKMLQMKQDWFLKELDCPVLVVENNVVDQLEKFGVKQFHERLGGLLERDGALFHLMTSNKVIDSPARFTRMSFMKNGKAQSDNRLAPHDASSAVVKQDRKMSFLNYSKVAIDFIREFNISSDQKKLSTYV